MANPGQNPPSAESGMHRGGTTWRVYLVAALIAAASGAITACVTVKLALSRLGVNHVFPQPPLTQRLSGLDLLDFPAGEAPSEKIVYYSTPFASPPNLRLTGGGDVGYTITDQTEKSFKLQRRCPVKGKEQEWRGVSCIWAAEGLPAK